MEPSVIPECTSVIWVLELEGDSKIHLKYRNVISGKYMISHLCLFGVTFVHSPAIRQ